jgi:hypothetical protein
LFDWAKSPVTVTAFKEILLLPALVNVSDWVELVPPMVWLGKFKLDADKLAVEEVSLEEDAGLLGAPELPPQPLRIMHAKAARINRRNLDR